MSIYNESGAFNAAVNDTTGKGRYSASGALRIQLVSGSSYVGLYAADGAMNVIIDPTGRGIYHPSGAIRGVSADALSRGLYAPNGAYYFAGLFSPLNLFSAGEQGVWYDPSDFSTMFQDSAGATPVTAVEQPVGRILDKSGRGNHATQATSASRPVLSARVNLLTKTEQFDDDTVWTKTNGTITATNIVDPLGGSTAEAFTEAVGPVTPVVIQNVSTAASVTQSFYVKPNGRTWVYLQMSMTGGSVPVVANRRVWFNLSGAGSVGTTGASYSSASITNVGNSWYRISAVINPAATGSSGQNTLLGITTGDNETSYTGDGTSGIYIWGADLRVTNDGVGLPAYQRVTTSTDYDTTGFPYYLRFDGTDDSLATASVNFSATDKMSVFSGVRKLSDAAAGFVVELTANASLNNGAFSMNVSNSTGDASRRTFGSDLRGSGAVTAASPDPTTYASPFTAVLAFGFDISATTRAGQYTTLRVNAINPSSVSYGGAVTPGTGNFANASLFIGRRGGASNPLNGRLYSLIVRGAQSTATEITNTETWVNGKTMAY